MASANSHWIVQVLHFLPILCFSVSNVDKFMQSTIYDRAHVFFMCVCSEIFSD